jgi:hypothetical protein
MARRLTGPMEEGEVAQSCCAAAHVEASRPEGEGGGLVELVGISPGAASRSPDSSKHPRRPDLEIRGGEVG